VLLQAGVNLINDHGDRHRPGFSASQRAAIRRNAALGWAAIAVAALFGCWMILLRGWPMLALCAVGLVGAWGYTGAPLNYKERGLGVPMVFLLMGVLLVGGAYYAASGSYDSAILWLSVPVSLFSSLLLLSNELRDYESDRAAGIRTLSVRLGYEPAVRLYQSIIALLLVSTLGLGLGGLIANEVIPLLSLAVLLGPLRLLRAPPAERRHLAPRTGRGFLAYGLALLASVWMGAGST
jgi:1,4-dihydroxy-2-naphthoate octaprenyltransferase